MSVKQEEIVSLYQTVVPVILSGGSGSRLWPVSRQSFPKQFWPLLGDNTLLQETVLRGSHLGLSAPVIVCNEEHRFVVSEQLRRVGVTNARVVLEPFSRNSAPAIAAAAFMVMEENPDAILWIVAADAAIQDEDLLKTALMKAVEAAKAGYIATFGICPTKPETGYGYIKRGKLLDSISNVYSVSQFIEKPNYDRALELFQNQDVYWNSGMFVARARTILRDIQEFEPELYMTVRDSVEKRTIDLDFERLAREDFGKAPNISIDYAVAERTKHAAVVPSQFGWSDIGSWDSLWELTPKDDEGNVALGTVFLDETQNCYVRSDKIVVSVCGVKDLVVVVTEDAVLVSHRDNAQDVKKAVERLAREGYPEALHHNRVYRPWGFYDSLIRGERFHVKRICVNPGHKLSLQKHFHRAEHWVVVAGTALVTRGEEEFVLCENESVYLPLGEIHRLENPGKIPLTLIEVQSGSYLDEDDIIRIEDFYSRA
ncbi:mannose-1-phosphate guanylyltransferase/mannose-6-phosphate isomerase [Saccharibacter sp. 17.LH.SD]|uniref:mannose-1-phosphate guanylyltransferase/mannose-6-phosphate isomerase n=1 Tax=Saccharibacter sp. 17.LH.SD TaxID=2689393 RepID=UPI00136EB490|nr:mannose-1-phosphate guanylyltransferase/mannose-6-phosphate isomerase [Saccharibacter sp. 17.LH.SD]MXV43510.1 mannose-1-phosphate guanylyltransferase/mannose-6-phosphate isomerase [Saccharibacter sp. 17.LH.SD]